VTACPSSSSPADRPPPQNEVSFSSFAEFKKAYFMPFLVTFQKLAVEKGVAKDDGEEMEGGAACAIWVDAAVKAAPPIPARVTG
jgi:hypothetical protein